MNWAATEAKAKFSEMLDKAESEGPQVVRRRKHEFVVISKAEFEVFSKRIRQTKTGGSGEQETLVEFFRNSPLAKSGIELKRLKLKPRHVGF